MSEGECNQTSAQTPIPLIYESLDASKEPKNNLVDILDEIERHVEGLRKEATHLEEERDNIFTTIDTLKNSQIMEDLSPNDRDDIERYADRIASRCATIEVTVKTIRDKVQEDALHQINKLIDNLVKDLQHDIDGTKMKCLSFMNSCTSYGEDGLEDKNFEQALLGCTVDDQKRVKRRLQGLMTYIEKLNIIS